MMPLRPTDVLTLESLRDFVHLALCKKENLLEHHFPMTEVRLERAGSCCGYQFTLHGPRSVRLSAVWDRTRNEVLLYDALGRRYNRLRMPNAIQA